MGVRDDELEPRDDFRGGLDNTSAETALPINALREATNVDMDKSGKLHRRQGYSRAFSAITLTHSLWSDEYLSFGLYVDGEALRALFEDASNEELRTGLAPGLPVSYDRINDAVAWTNGAQCGTVTQDLEVLPWACPSPNGQPTLAAGTGALDPGMYQVATTFIDQLGRESGTGPASVIDLPAGGGIDLSDIPQPLDAAVTRVRIYCTRANDVVLRRSVTLQAGASVYSIGQAVEGPTLKTQLLRPLPPGQIVRYGHGRQWVGRGNELLFSPSMRYGLFDPRNGRVGYAGRLALVQPAGEGDAGAGMYVSDSKRVYWHAGANPAKWSQKIAYHAPAVPGSAITTPGDVWGLQTADPVQVWLSRNGVWCLGLPGGQVVPMRNNAVVDAADSAASFYREANGVRQLVTSLRGAQPQGLAIRDRMIVREYRRDLTPQ